MTSAPIVLLCLAYILGLLSTGFSWGGYALLGGGVAIAAATLWLPLPTSLRVLKAGLKPAIWLLAGVIALLATFYFHWRSPQPSALDISRFIPSPDRETQAQVVTVLGKVNSTPRLTRSEKIQFWLTTHQLNELVGSSDPLTTPTAKTHSVTGKLYVTVPLLQGTGLYPGQRVEVTGRLYEPQPPVNPGGFDFKAYLARHGTFAGFAGYKVKWPAGNGEESWGLWQIRRRILRAQIRWLGVPEGPLLSAMVLGSRAVDLSYEIRDSFIQVGLAHVLAASGFHVAIVLGLVRVLTRRFSERIQFGSGTVVLLVYVALTGGSASVFRAAIMGFAALVAPLLNRKVNPLQSLLWSATFLLLFNPLWIWDLGFQLSFLATLGLLVTVPPLIERLDWLPPTIASSFAVPLAVAVWVLPLQLYTFGIVSPYSIPLNIVLAMPIAALTIVGFISAIAAGIWPIAGSALAWLLYYPLQVTIATVEFVSELPGNTVATGTLSLLQAIALYLLIGMVWLLPWLHRQRRWLFVFLFAVALVTVPVLHARATVFQVTVLATRSDEPVLVIQDRGQVILMNSGDDSTARYTILPFLRQQGIGQIDWAIATHPIASESGWHLILDRLFVQTFSSQPLPLDNPSAQALLKKSIAQQGSYQPLTLGEALKLGSMKVELLSLEPLAVEFHIRDRVWLFLGDFNPSEQERLIATQRLPGSDGESPLQVLWWSGDRLTPYLIEALQPDSAIASSDDIDSQTADLLVRAEARIYSVARDGALLWTEQTGFQKILDLTENDSPLL
ncbi:ComEC/Rec2 family competence protein [Phormidium sp. CCY1219]|uniref:ComEC/Rec2 family competence protein n=1 Tax=Phormidium sp. CCY1219 TaxID=2886104 RepID=UPI002D1F236D|nr:ComEC/Rec2 family competence protein [Phormidium sp. CCY1219]MEB3827660.1 ComEC/Rec2 family competence protein [Phormidium sp. CCY1219]